MLNTLLIRLFVYRLQVLLSPTNDFCMKFKKIITDFLWDAKKAVIAYHKLLASYEQGGLQLTDLYLKDLKQNG